MNEELKKDIAQVLKDNGMDIAEDAAKRAAIVGFEIIEKVVKHSSTKIDDLIALPLLKILRPKIMEYIDKIDGEVG